jgi:putative glycosyltransferase (TIGR04348 family)
MKIGIVTPAPARSLKGNRITAARWARLFRQLGHEVAIAQEFQGQAWDLLVALHAHRSAPSVERFHQAFPERRLIVALTGTDLYHDLATSRRAQRSLDLAWRLVVLQALAIDELPPETRSKARVIVQSAEPPPSAIARSPRWFEVCVLAHLRAVKDPFRTALAARLLPEQSRIRVLHLGAALSPAMAARARALEAVNSRYRWLGEQPRGKALRILARSRLLVLTSRLEGGANVLSEALGASVPVISSRIPGSLGILGADYPGYFPVGDTGALAALLDRAEGDRAFYRALRSHCARLKWLVSPARELHAWRYLLREARGATPAL